MPGLATVAGPLTGRDSQSPRAVPAPHAGRISRRRMRLRPAAASEKRGRRCGRPARAPPPEPGRARPLAAAAAAEGARRRRRGAGAAVERRTSTVRNIVPRPPASALHGAGPRAGARRRRRGEVDLPQGASTDSGTSSGEGGGGRGGTRQRLCARAGRARRASWTPLECGRAGALQAAPVDSGPAPRPFASRRAVE